MVFQIVHTNRPKRMERNLLFLRRTRKTLIHILFAFRNDQFSSSAVRSPSRQLLTQPTHERNAPRIQGIVVHFSLSSPLCRRFFRDDFSVHWFPLSSSFLCQCPLVRVSIFNECVFAAVNTLFHKGRRTLGSH